MKILIQCFTDRKCPGYLSRDFHFGASTSKDAGSTINNGALKSNDCFMSGHRLVFFLSAKN